MCAIQLINVKLKRCNCNCQTTFLCSFSCLHPLKCKCCALCSTKQTNKKNIKKKNRMSITPCQD